MLSAFVRLRQGMGIFPFSSFVGLKICLMALVLRLGV
jgi:hypothetical protein